MATYEALRQAIDSTIKANGNNEITGEILNNVLNAMITALGANYQFCGEAKPSTNPGQPLQNVFYFAYDAGTYTNFGNITLPLGISTLSWNGTQWTGDTIYQIDTVAQLNSTKLITSGAVWNAIHSIYTGIGYGKMYEGIADPSTVPSELQGVRKFYIATRAGTYQHFFSNGDIPLVIHHDGIWVISSVTGDDDDDWYFEDVMQLDNIPTKDSGNPVKSGGVFNNISAFDISELNATENPHTPAKYADLSAALNALPAQYRKGGMSVKYVQSSDNKYVQYRLMSDSFNATLSNWQSLNADDEPTAGSNNLVKSGGVKHEISQLEQRFNLVNDEFFIDFQKYPLYEGAINILYNYWTRHGSGFYVPLSDFGVSESIKIKAKTSNLTMVAFVESILDPFVEGASIDYMDGYSAAITLEAGSNEIELPKPNGDGYLWVYAKNSSEEDRAPEYIKKTIYVQVDDDICRNANESTKILGQTEFRDLYYTGTVERAFYGFIDFPNAGLVVKATGVLEKNSTTEHYRTTDYIPVTSNNKICYTELFPLGKHCGLSLYNSNKELIAYFGGDSQKGKYIIQDLSSYAEAAYIRASTLRLVTTIQPWRAVVLVCSSDFNLANSPIDDLNERIDDLNEEIDDLNERIENIGQTFHIGAGQQYTTLKAGFAAAIAKSNSIVRIHPGTYDLLQEFSAEISAATGISTGLALGNGMKVIFDAGAYVTCLYQLSGNSTKDRWVYDKFQPMYASTGDYYIEGLNIRCSNTRYCVHDERFGKGTYIHTYKNCNMYYENNHSDINYVQCIGGGLGEHGMIVIEGGIYESKTDYGYNNDYADTPNKAQQPISYHNGDNTTADSTIIISNVYLKNYGYFLFRGYGSSPIAPKAIVNNCSLGRETMLVNVPTAPDAAPFELTEFCCEVRNPEPNN